MPADVTREGFTALRQEVEGQKLVTRHILEQARRNGDDLAAIKARLDRVEEKLDGVDLKGLVGKVDGLDRKVDDLARNFPGIVAEALSDYEIKSKKKRRPAA
jgi:hypothetical protein